MAFDQDAVDEVMRQLQPTLDALAARLEALEERPEPSSEVVHPVKIVNHYADGSTKTWVEE